MSDPGSSSRSSSGLKNWISPRRKRFWLILLVLVYTLSGFFLAPWLIERIATQKVAELDRSLSIGDIKVNPFLLTMQIKDTSLHDSDGELLFSYDDYFLDLQASSLFRWAWTFKEIRLSGLQLNFERFAPGDDRFGRLIDSFPAAEEPPQEVTSQGLPRLLIQKLQINEAAFTLTDHLEHGKFNTQFGPINIEVAGLSTLPDQEGQQQVQIKTHAGGEIAWQGSLQLAPLKSAGKVTINGRVLADLEHYVALFTQATIAGDGVDVSFSYLLDQGENGVMSFVLENLDARYTDWAISLPGEDQPLLTFPELKISGAKLRFPEQEVEIESFTLGQPEVRLVLEEDGSLNLDRLLADFITDEPEVADDSLPWQLTVSQFGIEGGRAHINDRSTVENAGLLLQEISVQAADISNQDGASSPVQAGFTLATGGTGRFDGQAVLLPEFSSSGQFKLDSLQLTVAQPWLDQVARVSLNSGAMNLDGMVSMGPEQPGTFEGSARIVDFDLTDNVRKENLAGWKAMNMDRVEVDMAAGTARTSIIELTQPYGRLQVAADQTTNLDGLMIEAGSEEGTESQDQETTPEPPFAITLAGMEIEDASLDFSDLSLPLPFSTAIRSMDGTISTLATNSQEPARVDLEGQVNEFGLARIKGSLNAWDPVGFTDIQMTFRNLEMERMTPYTIEFAGWEIASGRMDLDLDYKIKAGQLDGANDIVIREMTVGDKVETPGGASLPLKLAVALLKDSDGVIDVDLPVSGDLNNPEFKIGGIVWKAIGNLIVKAVTAPFRLLGSLVGVDSEDFGVLHFSAGKSEVSPPDREQLLKLAEAMRQRPELRLEVSGTYVPELDIAAIQAQRVDERIEQALDAMQAGDQGITTDQQRQVIEQLVTTAGIIPDLVALQQEFSNVPEGEGQENAAPVLDEPAYLESLRQSLIEVEAVDETELKALAVSRADALVAVLSEDETTAPLPLSRGEAIEVEASKGGEIPLELKVESAN